MAEKIDVQGKEITIISREHEDYISLTDIAKYRNSDTPADIVKNWMRTRSTIEFLGLWEQLNNTGFKLVEFDQFKSEAGAINRHVRASGKQLLRRLLLLFFLRKRCFLRAGICPWNRGF